MRLQFNRYLPATAAVPFLDFSQSLPAWAQREFIGISIWQYSAAFLFLLLGLLLKKVTGYILEQKVIPFLEKTRISFDNLLVTALSKPLTYLFLLGGIAGAFAVLPLPTEPNNIQAFVFGILKILAAANIVWFFFRVVDIAVLYLSRLAQRTESQLDEQLVPLLQKALKGTIGIVAFLWILQLLGYNVSTLLAGLGIGGLAVAIALQETLANFFGSLAIFLDRPFVVGDWIKINDVEGIVTDVGFRSTRIKTWLDTIVAIPNKAMAAGTIDNWSKMTKRRVFQVIGVTYATTADEMETLLGRIQAILKNDPGVQQDLLVVRFTDFGDSSLNITLLYFTTGLGFVDHSETKQRVNLAIMRTVKEMGLSIAFPTRTIHLEGKAAEKLAAASAGKNGPEKKIEDEKKNAH